jgi:hypothetical protein
MDLTLRQYSETCDILHNKLNQIDAISVPSILYELESYIKLLQSVAFKAAKLYNIYNKRLLSNEKLAVLLPKKENFIDKDKFKPSNDDCDQALKKVVQSDNTRVLAPNILINPIIVDSEEKVPNCNLYYLENSNEFAIKLNGILLKGHIGDVFPKDAKNVNSVKQCIFGANCHAFRNGKCKYFHDPHSASVSISTISNKLGAKRLKYLDEVKTNPKRQNIRNFTTCNWLYTKELRSAKNMYMRHFGSRSSLACDLDILKMDNMKHLEIDKFKSTLFHDMLVLMALNQKGLLDDNQDIVFISKKFSGQPILNII